MTHFPLESLPGELLSIISDYSVNLVNLWKCGNHVLTAKLANGVTRVDLKDDDWTSTSRWPKLLSRLTNLRSLSIKRANGCLLPKSTDLSREIRSLSPSLRELSLSFRGWNEALHNFDLETGEVIWSQYERGVSPWFDLSSHFPCLERVVFGGEQSGDFQTHHIAALPETILSVTLPSAKIVAGENNLCALLPRKCESLIAHLTLGSAAEDALTALPQSLTHLESIYLNRATDVALLPRGIKSGSISFQRFTWNSALAKAAPPLIDNIMIASLHHEYTTWAEELPRHLVIVTDLTHNFSFVLDATLAASLPRTLVQFRMPAPIDYTSLQNWQSSRNGVLPWPPGLAVLLSDSPVENETLTRNQQHILLPRSLTSLKILIEDDASHLDWSGLPQGLKTLHADYIRHNTLTLPTSPPNLTSLTLYGNLQLSPGGWPSLTCLHCSIDKTRSDIEYFRNTGFPSNLESLTIQHWSLNFHLLPKTLTKLQLQNIHIVEDIDAMAVENALLELPTSLQMLSLNALRSLPTMRRFALLPQLRELNCEGFGQFDSVVLHTLAQSRRLVTLRIQLESLNQADLPALESMNSVTTLFLHLNTAFDAKELARVWPLRSKVTSPSVDREAFRQRYEEAESASFLYPDPRISKDVSAPQN